MIIFNNLNERLLGLINDTYFKKVFGYSFKISFVFYIKIQISLKENWY